MNNVVIICMEGFPSFRDELMEGWRSVRPEVDQVNQIGWAVKVVIKCAIQ